MPATDACRDPKQNSRSPDQQFDTIENTRNRCGFPWIHVTDYRDDGISGRLQRRRPAFQKLLLDIRTGRIKIDFILVDTLERLGRLEEMPELRRELYNTYGVLVLTADSIFSDPLSVAGKAVTFVEGIRGTEDSRIKAHNVLRGKRDAALQKHWPGGAAPLGFKLQTVFKEVNGRQEADYSILVEDPLTSWIIRLAYKLAVENGWGQTLIARSLNLHPDIPDALKPIGGTVVGGWLKNPIYHGELVFGRQCTDIIDDHQVTELNDEEDVIHVPDFCAPLIERSVFDRVAELRAARTRWKPSKQPTDVKQIRPLAAGMVLTYPLTGLVRCGHCKRAMRPTSHTYKTAKGKSMHYRRYCCPGYIDRSCTNGVYVNERWLMEKVAETIRRRLFGL